MYEKDNLYCFDLCSWVTCLLLFGKQMITKENINKPTVELTVYTLSSSDTEKWNKVRQVETEEAIYFITVKEAESSEEVFSNIIANGAATGFGVREEEVKKFNNDLGDTIEGL